MFLWVTLKCFEQECVCEPPALRGPKRPEEDVWYLGTQLQVVVSHLICMLESEPGTSTRVACALNRLAVFSHISREDNCMAIVFACVWAFNLLECECVCVCMWCTHVLVHAPVTSHGVCRKTQCPVLSLSTLVLWDKVSSWAWSCCWPQATTFLSSLLPAYPITLGLQVHAAVPGCLQRPWDLNSSLHTCEISPLTYQSLQYIALSIIRKSNFMSECSWKMEKDLN